MTPFVALVVSLVFFCVAVTVDSTALRNQMIRELDDNGTKFGPIVAPLFITQYDRFEGPATSLHDFYYQLPLSVGTPARDFNLTLDMYGGANLLFAQNFTGTTDCARKQPARNLYSISSSSAFDVNADVNIASDYFDQPYINAKCSLPAGEDLIMDGDDLHDDLKISNTAAGKMEFNLVQTINSLNPGWRSDGIFSYYMEDLDEDDTSYMYNFRNLSTVLHLLSGAQPAGSPTLGGHLIFGADSEDSMCFDDWTAVDSTLARFTGLFYGVSLSAVTLGNETVRNTNILEAGLLQLSSAYIKMNKLSLSYFAKALGADFDFRRDTFTVDCGTISTLPDIVFRIKRAAPATSDSMEYRVPANVYVKKLDPVDKRCTLLLKECGSEDYDCTSGSIWRLGSTFFRPYCQRIHYGYNHGYGPVLSFAKARF